LVLAFIFDIIIFESHHDLRVGPLQPTLLDFLLFVLEDLSSFNPVHIAIDLSHEGNGHILHEVENVDCGPGAFPVKKGWVGPLVSRGALQKDCPLWK
jgi:hypothetical protein